MRQRLSRKPHSGVSRVISPRILTDSQGRARAPVPPSIRVNRQLQLSLALFDVFAQPGGALVQAEDVAQVDHGHRNIGGMKIAHRTAPWVCTSEIARSA